MNTKSKVALVSLGVVAGLGLGAAGLAGAAEANETSLPPMVQGLAEKFNLSQEEVASYLETEREERQVEREAEFTASLDTATTEGTLTEAQKTALIAKHEELQTKREALRTVSGPDKRDDMQTIRDEWQAFLTAQGIDEDILPQQGPNGGGMNGTGRGMHRNNQ
jgi:hypothetical protein